MRYRWAGALPVLVLLVTGCATPDANGQAPGGSGSTTSPGATTPTSQSVRPLSKTDGWREGLLDSFTTTRPEEGHPYGLVEIAYDRAAAERAWADNVPEGLPSRSGTPVEDGRYGDLETVDFDTEAVVVWSSGQSGSCPGWLADISADAGASPGATGEPGGTVSVVTVDVTTGRTETTCTDDYNTYRMVLAVERDWLPEPAALPIDQVTMNGKPQDVLVDHYPTGG